MGVTLGSRAILLTHFDDFFDELFNAFRRLAHALREHISGRRDDLVRLVDVKFADGAILMLGAHFLQGVRGALVVADGQGRMDLAAEDRGDRRRGDADRTDRLLRGVDFLHEPSHVWLGRSLMAFGGEVAEILRRAKTAR